SAKPTSVDGSQLTVDGQKGSSPSTTHDSNFAEQPDNSQAARAGIGASLTVNCQPSTVNAAPCASQAGAKIVRFHRQVPSSDRSRSVIRMPSFEAVRDDPVLYAHASRILHSESNPGNARALVQRHGSVDVWLNPPPLPLTTKEMDAIYELPYRRVPHPTYGNAKIPAYEMIRFSVAIQRGCFGGCTFCSITEHEGRIIQNRSEESIIKEIETVRDTVPGSDGVTPDAGGATEDTAS